MVRLEKGALSNLFQEEIEFIRDIPLKDCRIASGFIRHGNSKFERILLTYDIYFDLSFAYPEGWLRTIYFFGKQLKEKENRSIIQIAVGGQHTIIVDDLSNVYSMGLGDLGQLGHNNRNSSTKPRLLENIKQLLASSRDAIKLKSMKQIASVKEVCCGKDHTLLLTASGSVFSWGDNRKGQLGHSNFESSALPRLVVAGSTEQKQLKYVTQIACGSYHSVCIADPGLLYTWGCGGCLGRIESQDIELSATASRPSGKASIRASMRASFNSSNANDFFTRRTSVAKLPAHFDQERKLFDSCVPDVIPFFKKKKVHLVCSGENHLTVLTGSECFSWGSNNYGQLGIGSTEEQRLPTKVFIRNFSEQEILQAKLFSGGRHMMLLCRGQM
jgi:alpha-tubulin suppressor-like RCC1 family protein